MFRRRKGFGAGSEVDSALRGHRPEARDDFVEGLSSRILAEKAQIPRGRSRVAFAAAASVFILGTFASFGGLGYAASGAAGAYHAAKQVAVNHTLILSVHKSSAADQYGPKPKPKTHPQSGVAGAKTGVAGIAGVSSGGTLPFTGLSLLGTLILSLGLILLGIALRRRERRN